MVGIRLEGPRFEDVVTKGTGALSLSLVCVSLPTGLILESLESLIERAAIVTHCLKLIILFCVYDQISLVYHILFLCGLIEVVIALDLILATLTIDKHFWLIHLTLLFLKDGLQLFLKRILIWQLSLSNPT